MCSQDQGIRCRREYFTGTAPTDECNVHVSMQICKDCTDESKYQACQPYCPKDSVEKVFIKHPVPYTPTKPVSRHLPIQGEVQGIMHIHGPSFTTEPRMICPMTRRYYRQNQKMKDETLFPWFLTETAITTIKFDIKSEI